MKRWGEWDVMVLVEVPLGWQVDVMIPVERLPRRWVPVVSVSVSVQGAQVRVVSVSVQGA